MDNDYLKEYLTFSNANGIGPIRFDALISYFKNISNAYEAPEKDIAHVIGSNFAKKFIEFKHGFDVDKYIRKLDKHQVSVLTRDSSGYPKQLLEISDPPICLYVKGNISSFDWDDFYFAVVGTRKPSEYGKEITRTLSQSLALSSCIIVSGMALGVDSIAHWQAVKSSKKTIAVLGCGVDVIYPSSNTNLYNKIIETGGLIISEFPLGRITRKGHFVARNRIISGISKGVLITEGLVDSGSLITARFALSQGKDVFAPPSPITSSMSKAPNLLLKEGAKMVTCIDDILEEYPLETKLSKIEKRTPSLNFEEKAIYQLLAREAFSADELARTLKVPIFKILPVLSNLELSQVIDKNESGKYFII